MEENNENKEIDNKLDSKSRLEQIKNGLFKNTIKSIVGEDILKKDEEEGDDRDIDDMYNQLFKDAEDNPTE